MRRTARALSLAAVAGTVLGALAPAASAGTAPGSGPTWGTVSPSPCPPAGGHAREGHVPYGSRSAAPDAPEPETFGEEALEPEVLEDGALGEAPEPDTLGQDPLAPGGDPLVPEDTVPDAPLSDELVPDAVLPGEEAAPAPADGGPAQEGRALEQRVRSPQPVTPRPKPTPSRPTPSPGTPCPLPPPHQGVHAGGGGAFTDSVPALAAGGLLIAGAFGAAGHRLYRDRTTRSGA